MDGGIQLVNESKAASGDAIRILVAEDSPTQVERLEFCLATRGYAVTVAKNGMEALAAAVERKPTLVISDVVMPGMDGFDLCKEIKSHAGLKDVPVILVTSLARPQDVLRGLECGADSFIRKPYDEKYLLLRIDHILMNQELRKTERPERGVELSFRGEKYVITAEKQQILDLLISTYEGAIQINEELETKQRDLEALNKELESFSYTVSHDLRSPLRHIDGYSALLLETHGEELDPEVQRILNVIRNTAKNMARLVEDLLNMARLGRQQIDLQMTDLNALLENVLRELEPEVGSRQIEWQIGNLPRMHCDPGLMRPVFTNLLSNAVKYTRRRERAIIQVDHMATDGEPVIFVRDNGAGFDRLHASKLFGVFQRLHSADEFEGTGVGLATVQRIVQKHGGRVWAESELDKGATFFFTLGRAALGSFNVSVPSDEPIRSAGPLSP
jgi:two-component system sensor histidine kinase/response regulator